jgi:hypothetical protein
MPRRLVVLAVAVVAAAVLVLGTLDTLVWMPQELAPTTPLAGIYGALDRSGDLPYCVGNAVVWAVLWSVMSIGYCALLLPAHPRLRSVIGSTGPFGAAALGALLLGAIGFFHWWSAFAMAMSVSDELPPGAGGTTGLGMVIVLGGLLAGVTGAVLGVIALVRTARRSAPA